MSGVAFDARALTEPVNAPEAKQFARTLRGQGGTSSSNIVGIVVTVVAVAIVGVVFLSVGAGVIAALLDGRGGAVAAVPLIVVALFVAAVAFFIVRGARGQAERWWRLDRFARANGLGFVPRVADPQLPGMIFHRGSNRQSSDVVRGAQPRFVEFANYRYVTGSGKNRTTHRWGYVAVKLDVPLPNIILDATGNNGLFGSNLPTVYDRDQRLSLEGDFDRHFSLYCPSGYERDALYLFTPDIMARFIDNAAQLDVEIVDDWLFFYAKRDLSTLDPATWGWLFTVVAALLDKLAQWARWRDDRLAVASAPVADSVASGIPGAQPGIAPALTPPPPGVAASGRRLRAGVPWVAILIFVVLGAGWLFTTLGGWALFGG